MCKFGCEKIQWKLLNYAFLFSGKDFNWILEQKIVAALVYLGKAKKLKFAFLYLYVINCSLFAQVAIYFYLNGLVDCWIRAEKFGNPLLIFWRENFFSRIF